ncbi:hypothetical protein MMC27_008305 [Xylographa pallens]|nr:hypothetical protein [Xylographa pallens]
MELQLLPISNIQLFQLLASVIFLLYLGRAVYRHSFSSISDIPAPNIVASVSIWWQAWHAIKGDTHTILVDLHKEKGTFVRVSHKEVAVCHPEAILVLLKKALPKAPWYRVFAIPNQGYQNQMSETDPARHIHIQKNIASGYAISNIISTEPAVDKSIIQLENKLAECSKTGSVIDFEDWFNYFAFDVVGSVTFSRDFGFLEAGRDIGSSIAAASFLEAYFGLMGHFYWLHKLLLENYLITWLKFQPKTHLLDLTLSSIAGRKADREPRNDMIEQWITMRRKYPDRMDDLEIHGASAANLGAGADTVAGVLQAFMYSITKDKDRLNILTEELDGATSRAELDPIATWAQVQRLPYLQACIKETLRWHPVFAWGLPRIVPKGGVTIAGRSFTEGITLTVAPWSMHHDPRLWGPDVELWRPERWLEPKSKELDKFFMPFGWGYQQCPGQRLALFEIGKLMATIIRDFDFELVNPSRWVHVSRFLAMPKGSCKCTVKQRLG